MVRRRIVVWALRHQLLVQLHTYLYILPPLSTAPRLCDAPSNERNARIDSRLKESKLDPAVVEALSDICHLKRETTTPDAVFEDLQLFLRYYRRVENQAWLQHTVYFCLIAANAEITVFSGRTKKFAQ
jgi:hypothetical protein